MNKEVERLLAEVFTGGLGPHCPKPHSIVCDEHGCARPEVIETLDGYAWVACDECEERYSQEGSS